MIYINGKFIAQPTTGVQRFARELVLAMDLLLSESDNLKSYDVALVIPSEIKSTIPSLKFIRVVELPGSVNHYWEQVSLPLFVGNSVLINLSGSAPLLKRKQICTFHDAAIFEFSQAYSKAFVTWYRLLFRVQSRLCLSLLTVSEFSRSCLCQYLSVENDRFGIVHNGIDHIFGIETDENFLKKHDLNPNSYLLTVGSANPSKNFAALIKAYSTLNNVPSIPLVLVGGSNSAVFAKQEISENVNIIWIGRVDDAQLKALYTHARAFVFPSLYEGFGIPPLEAMACGCPVIASNVTSIPEICGDAVGYFDPASILSIQSALERIMVDDEWRMSLRAAGAEKVKQYTWRAAALQLFQHLKKFGVIDDPVPSK